jgi:hypothetical protein
MSAAELAQLAYEAYAAQQDWKNYQGLPIPEWALVRADIKEAWTVAVIAVWRACQGMPNEPA